MAHTIQVVKGRFFGSEYWAGKMSIASVERIRPPSDHFWDHIFDPVEGAQRDLNKRRVIDQMVPYLLNKTAHPFFSAITVILVPVEGDHLKEGEDFTFKQSSEDPDVGTLEIKDHVLLFPADGQHRREAMAQAYNQDKTIHSEEVPVILLPFESVERVRQLFADLNLHAKNPGKSIGLAYDYRDPIAILAKCLMAEVALFDNGKRVNTKTNSLSAKSPAVISLNTLVEMTKHILAAQFNCEIKRLQDHPALKAIASLEPGDKEVKKLARQVADVIDVIIGAFPQWQDVMDERRTAGQIRDGVKNEDGEIEEIGYVFAFGLGWQALGLVAAAIIRVEEEDWSEALQRAIASVDWRKGQHWNGIAMIYPPDSENGRVNNTGPGIRSTAGYVLTKVGYGDVEDEDVQGLIETYEAPDGTVTQAA